MATLKEYRDERLQKLAKLRELGYEPYPAHSNRDTRIRAIHDSFNEFESKAVTVAGRIMAIRGHGKLKFFDIDDGSSRLQLLIRADELQADVPAGKVAFEHLDLLGRGDFIECHGIVTKTKTGQISIQAESLRILTKAIRPIPDDWTGLSDKETRLRRRYLDMALNDEVRQRFIRRSKFWQATRDFLIKEGFIEVNTSVLEHTTGGADARPFETHMDALDEKFYLRISHELPLKRLIGGGYEKVFDIGPRFRNENYSDEHLPEHVAMEWYWAYADWNDGIKFQTDMFRYVLEKTFGTLEFQFNDVNVDLSKDWEQWDYAETIRKHYDIDVYDCSLDEVKQALKDHKLEVAKSENKARGIDKLWKNIRKDVAGPVWLINTPLFISPLAKANPALPHTVERFQPIMMGSELGTGWSELNDPVDQLNRFLEQQKLREAGDDEAQMLDIDYVEMLEYGMPPTCGWGNSERVFWTFEGVSAREGVPFPQLRREISDVTHSIYPEVNFKA